MENENQEPQTEKSTASDLKAEASILEEYQKLKATSVSKEKYETDLKQANDRAELYLKAITEGGNVDTPTDKDSPSLQEMVTDISKFKGTNLGYWQKMTPAIDKMLKEVPQAEIEKTIGKEGLEGIIRVNEGMKEMVEKANGDPDYFRAIYKNEVADSARTISADIERAGGLINYLQNLK